MSDQCSTCAFGESGGAASEPNNRLKGFICALAGIPFFCHHDRSGREYDWQAGKLGVFELPPAERRVSGGWKLTVAKLAKRGHFRFSETAEDQFLLRRYQQSVGNAATHALDDFLAARDPEAKAEAQRQLRMNLEALRTEKGI